MNAKKKYKSLWIWMGVGLLLSLVLFVSLIPKMPEWIKIIFTILSSLGGGIFASAFIALLIEKGHDRRQEEEIKDQKKMIFHDLQFYLPILLRHEANRLSFYLSLCKGEQVHNSRLQDKSIEKIITECKNYLEKIKESKEERFSNEILIDETYMSRHREMKNSFQISMTDYQQVQSSLKIIKDNSALYMINGCLSTQEKGGIDDLYNVIDSILQYIEIDEQDYVIEYKILFFEMLKGFCDLISLDTNQLQKVSVWEKTNKEGENHADTE